MPSSATTRTPIVTTLRVVKSRRCHRGLGGFAALPPAPVVPPEVVAARAGPVAPRRAPVVRSAINVLDRSLMAGWTSLHAVPEQIGGDHVVPAALCAHLDDTDAELAELILHLFELGRRLDAAAVLAELLTERVVQRDQPAAVPDRAADGAEIPVMERRPDQHRVGVADILTPQRTDATAQPLQRVPALQRVVDGLPLGPHDVQGRR